PILKKILIATNIVLQLPSGKVIKIDVQVIGSCTNNNQSIANNPLTFIHTHNTLKPLNVAEGTRHLPHLWDLCYNKITVRSAKHILKSCLLH
uniref:Uncharacterized protein n=1 Tax=Cucumis melo TaxID=3656 RepID=A0A9I9EDC0_CUCME